MKKLLSLNDIKISKELEWIRPYLKKVNHLAPIGRVPKIIAVKASKDKLHNFTALICGDDNSEEIYYISMYLYVYRTKRIKPFARQKSIYSKIGLLECLAHELSHLIHWEHTVEHKRLENRICNIFMAQLGKAGYVSEEHELKHNRPKYPTL